MSNLKISVVDDERLLRVTLVDDLKDAGYEVKEYSNAKSLLMFLIENKTDVVITAIMMTDMDGLELLSKLKELDTKQNKIVFSHKKVDSKNLFLYHKTTNRTLYDNELKKARKNGFYDVVFTNEKDEITEGTISTRPPSLIVISLTVKTGSLLFNPIVFWNDCVAKLSALSKTVTLISILPVF